MTNEELMATLCILPKDMKIYLKGEALRGEDLRVFYGDLKYEPCRLSDDTDLIRSKVKYLYIG